MEKIYSAWKNKIFVQAVSVRPELIKNAVDRIKAAAEMGDVMKITSIAKELECESDGMASFCNQLIQMAEDFDFNGIQNFMIKLDR